MISFFRTLQIRQILTIAKMRYRQRSLGRCVATSVAALKTIFELSGWLSDCPGVSGSNVLFVRSGPSSGIHPITFSSRSVQPFVLGPPQLPERPPHLPDGRRLRRSCPDGRRLRRTFVAQPFFLLHSLSLLSGRRSRRTCPGGARDWLSGRRLRRDPTPGREKTSSPVDSPFSKSSCAQTPLALETKIVSSSHHQEHHINMLTPALLKKIYLINKQTFI